MAWIAGQRVILRAWEREDVRRRWEAEQTTDPTEARLRDWLGVPKSLQQLESEFDLQVSDADPTNVPLIIELDGRVVGDIDLYEISPRNRCCRIGLSIWREEDRGHGVGRDAMYALLRRAFRELNMHRVELSVDPGNERAIRLYRKLGFQEEGARREAQFADGRYNDGIMMGLLDREFEAREAGRSLQDRQRAEKRSHSRAEASRT